MRIIIATLTGKKIVLEDIRRTDNFELLNKILFEEEGYAVDTPRYIFAGKEIEQNRTFYDYNIQTDSTIHVVLRLRGPGGSSADQKPFPTISQVAHGGMEIFPSFPCEHQCDAASYRENYRRVYKANKPLYFSHPLRISFNLKKLRTPRKCYAGEAKKKGGGFLVNENQSGKMTCYLKIFHLENGKVCTDAYAKMIRNRKLVLSTSLAQIGLRSEKKGNFSVTVFPKGKRQWERNAVYMCVVHNEHGGFRWTFSTSTVLEEEDLNERVGFLHGVDFTLEMACSIQLSNITLYHFGLL